MVWRPWLWPHQERLLGVPCADARAHSAQLSLPPRPGRQYRRPRRPRAAAEGPLIVSTGATSMMTSASRSTKCVWYPVRQDRSGWIITHEDDCLPMAYSPTTMQGLQVGRGQTHSAAARTGQQPSGGLAAAARARGR